VRRGRYPDINNGAYFPTRFDTRHNVNVVALYSLSKRWQLTATWVYTSGYTSWLPSGRLSFQDVAGSPIQLVVPVYGARNTFRVPAYTRFDLGVVWKFKTKRLENDLTLSVYNATDRRNPYFIFLDVETEKGDPVDFVTGIKAKQVSLFPVLPSITWNFKF
jgi:hypothetical protein